MTGKELIEMLQEVAPDRLEKPLRFAYEDEDGYIHPLDTDSIEMYLPQAEMVAHPEAGTMDCLTPPNLTDRTDENKEFLSQFDEDELTHLADAGDVLIKMYVED